MSAMLDFVAKLNELNTDDVAPTVQVAAPTSALRPDEVTCSSQPEDAVANAPHTENHYFVVPSIIE
jgi:aspartyl-tRNA(Asn)/glutamyl-tRNA(Gln) amidotransferase subunit C